MKQQTKLNQKQEQHAEQQTQAAKEFSNADELLRFDAAQTILPPEVAKRLQESVANIPPPPRTWWRNLFKR